MPNSLNDPTAAAFYEAISLPDEQIDLLECTLLIAQIEYPLLNRSSYVDRIEEIAAPLQQEFAADSLARIVQVKRLLFEQLGFHGNREDYYDPRNSFMNDVIDRRTGIPITLSLVLIEVGRRLGLPLVGIGLPGHFLVGSADRFDIFVDAFDGGRILTRSDATALFRSMQPGVPFRPEFLSPVRPAQFLTRILNNLLEIYLRAARHAKALPMLERIIVLNPNEHEWIRRRAALHSVLKNYASAARDLERYLALVPDSPDRDELARNLGLLHHLRGMVN
jgi:regulator of sirC expression with transglutaminase-like and TPR domain